MATSEGFRKTPETDRRRRPWVDVTEKRTGHTRSFHVPRIKKGRK